MNLAASNVSIAEVVRLASSFGVGLAPGTTAAGQLTANIHADGAVDRPALNGNLTGTNLQLTSGQMSEPVKIPSLQVAMTPTTIHTNQFTPSAGDASVNMQLTLNNYTSDSPNIQFDISGNKLNLNYLQRLISSPPPQQQQKRAEGWSLIPRANAAPTAPASNDSILQRATGNGNINVGTLTYDNLVLTNVQSKVDDQSRRDHGITADRESLHGHGNRIRHHRYAHQPEHHLDEHQAAACGCERLAVIGQFGEEHALWITRIERECAIPGSER